MQKCNVLRHSPFYSRVEWPFFACTNCEYPSKEIISMCLALIKYCSKLQLAPRADRNRQDWKRICFPSFEDLFGCIFPNVARARLLSSPRRSSDSGRYGLFSDEGCNPRGFGDVGWSGIKKSDPFKPRLLSAYGLNIVDFLDLKVDFTGIRVQYRRRYRFVTLVYFPEE